MTTPPPRVSRSPRASPAARFAYERVSVSAAPEKSEKSEKRPTTPTTGPITPAVGGEAVASDVVPTTQFGVTQNKAEDARVDSSEAETQTEGPKEREEKNDRSKHLDPTRRRSFATRDALKRSRSYRVTNRTISDRPTASRPKLRRARRVVRRAVRRAGPAAAPRLRSGPDQIPIGAHPRARRSRCVSIGPVPKGKVRFFVPAGSRRFPGSRRGRKTTEARETRSRRRKKTSRKKRRVGRFPRTTPRWRRRRREPSWRWSWTKRGGWAEGWRAPRRRWTRFNSYSLVFHL